MIDTRCILKKLAVCLLMALILVSGLPKPMEAAASDGQDLPKPVYNIGGAKIKSTYMVTTDSGYMRVVCDRSTVFAEYYDNSFNLTGKKTIKMEFPIWGGFYKGSDAYYLVEGSNNTNCVDNTEVVRIIKYDTSWNRLGSGSIRSMDNWDYEIRYPFDWSCVSMTESDGKLYVATGREGYVDPKYGQGHQGMMLIRMNESSFDTEIVYGDFWHSFSQYIQSKGTDIYVYEQSEGSRCTQLSHFDGNSTGTDYFDAFDKCFSVLDYGGKHTSAWAIPCYASADDLELSAENILGIGTSIDQSKYDNYDWDTNPYNIYLTVTPQADLTSEATKVLWLTNYKSGTSISGVSLTKVNEDRFLVTWGEYKWDQNYSDNSDLLSNNTLHYLFIDGDGNMVSPEYTTAAAYSDCHPVIKGDLAVYCASTDNCVDFYTINTENGDFSKRIYATLENIEVDGVENKVYTGKAQTLKLSVYVDDKLLKKGTDYTLSYQNNINVGTATVTINGKGIFSGSKTLTFKILPKATTIKKVTSGKKSIKVSWKKQAQQITGYEIQYSTNKNFKKGTNSILVKKATATKKTIKKLKSKKTYYVRIRTYKTIGSKNYNSKWSKSKKIKAK